MGPTDRRTPKLQGAALVRALGSVWREEREEASREEVEREERSSASQASNLTGHTV